MRICRYAVITLSLLAAGLAYSATAPKTTPRKSAPAAARGTQAALPDAELEKAIRARFATSKISRHNFKVRVQGGVATIEGQTDVLQHKGTATRLAKNLGAIQVINKIEVSQEAKDKAAGNLTTGRRRAQVKRSQTADRSEKRSE